MPLGGPRIKCTRAEVDYLHAERLAAMRSCPDLDYQRWRQQPTKFWLWSSRLEVIRRCKDGSLIARIVIQKGDSKRRWVRKIRVHHSLGSTAGRGLELRRVSTSG